MSRGQWFEGMQGGLFGWFGKRAEEKKHFLNLRPKAQKKEHRHTTKRAPAPHKKRHRRTKRRKRQVQCQLRVEDEGGETQK